MILNASNSVGRVTAGYIAAYTGVLNLTVIAAISCGSLIFGLIGLKSLTSVVILGVLYGYFAGMYDAIVGPLVATLATPLNLAGGWVSISLLIDSEIQLEILYPVHYSHPIIFGGNQRCSLGSSHWLAPQCTLSCG